MATDPGDLVLDPTCGSGTTAYVAEQWGRRWITIDTSRVALALARTRVMGARYPYYLWVYRLFSGCRSEIQASAMEVDGVDKVLFVAETSCGVLDPLDLGVDGFAGGVGDGVLEVSDDVVEA